MKKKLLVVLLLLISISVISCKKDPKSENLPTVGKISPDNFTYSTTKKVDINIQLLANDNSPLKGVLVSLNPMADLSENASVFKAISDNNGNIKASINIPAYLDTLTIDAKYIGLIRHAKAFITNNKLTCTIGGENGFGGNIAASEAATSPAKTASLTKLASATIKKTANTSYDYMGLFDLAGRPLYREAKGDVIGADLLSYLNTSLPEEQDVRNHHQNYLSATATSTLNITKTSDIWVTFVSEGAAYYNTIGFYTYPTNQPPQTLDEIEKVSYIFPNASLAGEGGGLRSGDKVKLGTFQAGTSIGFVLLSNAWYGLGVSSKGIKYYSNTNLNPESTSSLKRHVVMLSYPEQDKFLIGFEDMARDNAQSDHDFNDVVIMASSSPVDAISTIGVQSLEQIKDSDKDGIADKLDSYPNDASRAYTTYFPSQNTWGTIAFEDNWPSTGDYDLNDMVVKYKYEFVKNAQNQVVEMTGSFTVQAAGAGFENGFGVQFPFSPSLVSSVTGQKFKDSFIQLTGNGLEAGQSKAVIIPFDNTNALIANEGGAWFVNTKTSMPKVHGDTANVKIKFVSPIATESLGTAPFNPFLISNKRRGYEIHLPGAAPTDKADKSLFGTANDNSSVAANRYYLAKDNSPWAINFTEQFNYPIEESSIKEVYLHFMEWTNSGGTKFVDWYKNTDLGYRNTGLIYSK